MKQELIKGEPLKVKMLAKDLDFGQLGRIVDSVYNGLVITKCYRGLVCVYSPDDEKRAFKSCWGHDCTLEVELLENESVVLSN